jgi:uncharacterized glyoxalase superfamily protein PhnB
VIIRTSFVIAVADLKASSAFYREVLGFKIEELGEPGWLSYKLGACTIMAGECREAMPAAQLGDHSYFAYLEVEHIEAYYRSVQASGAQFIKTLRDEPWGMREFGVRTADGHRIMFGSRLER